MAGVAVSGSGAGGIAGAGESTAASAVGSNILNLETARPGNRANETTGADAAKPSKGAGFDARQ